LEKLRGKVLFTKGKTKSFQTLRREKFSEGEGPFLPTDNPPVGGSTTEINGRKGREIKRKNFSRLLRAEREPPWGTKNETPQARRRRAGREESSDGLTGTGAPSGELRKKKE